MNDVLTGVLASGINKPTVVAVHVALLACMGSLVFLLSVTAVYYPAVWPHVVVLLVLALALQVGMLWLVGEVGVVSPEQQRKELFGEGWNSGSDVAGPQEAEQQQPGGTGSSSAADELAGAEAVERRKEQ